MPAGAHDASSRFPWPPVIFGSGGMIAALLTWASPLALAAPSLVSAQTIHGLRWIGWIVIALAILLAGIAEIQFLRAGTATLPTSPTSRIVSHGVYALTRNPMYLAMSLALAGLALAFNSSWFALALLMAIPAVTKLAIEREEAYLLAKFGQEYANYCTQTRRWL